MHNRLHRTLPVPVIAILLLVACGAGGPSDQEVLITLTDSVVVPAYEAVAEDAEQLDNDARALCNAPTDAGLQAAQESWRNAIESWSYSEPMWFGPVMDRRSLRLIDWSPTDTAAIDRLLADSPSLSVEEVSGVLASNQRGFGAIEYILFGGDALQNLTSSPVYCSYLTALTTVVREETSAILADWVTGVGRAPYKDYFTNQADISIVTADAVSEVVRTQVFLIRSMVDMRLASALGLRESTPDLTAIPGNAADNGLQDLRNELLGMQDVYLGSGDEGLGISDLVSSLSQETDTRLRDQFPTAIQAVDSVQGTLRLALEERPDQVRNVYDRLSELQQTISVDVVSLLGVSVGFTDTDGDSLR